MKKRVAGYGRVSTIGQLRGTSKDEQQKIIKEECKRRDFKLVKFYDDTYSGKSTDRPGLQRLIEDAKENKFEAIMFCKLDRLGRSLLDILNLWKIFTEELGLEIVCVLEPALNSSGKMANILLAFLGAFAEFERVQILERTVSGRMAAWKNKKSIMGNLPYAYFFDSEKKQILVNEEEKKLYDKIVSLYIDEHHSMLDIANLLSEQGIACPSSKYKTGKAKRWNQVTIRKILNNPSFKGELISNRFKYVSAEAKKTGRQYAYAGKVEKPESEWIITKIPALISQEKFDSIQSRIRSQKGSIKKSYKDYEDRFLVGNMIFCGECDSKMHRRVRETSKGGASLHYRCFWRYASQKQLEASNHKRCNLPAINSDVVDKEIYRQIVDFLVNPARFVDKFYEEIDSKEIEERLDRLEKQKASIKKTIGRYYELYGIVDGEAKTDLVNKVKKLNIDLQFVQQNLTEVDKENSFAVDKQRKLEEFKDGIKKVGSLKKEIKTFLKGLSYKDRKRIIESVIAPENGGKITVRFANGIDLLDHEDLKGLTEDEFKELLETKYPERKPIVDLNFKADLTKILTLIDSLKDTHFLEKGYSHTVSRQRENANHKRCI